MPFGLTADGFTAPRSADYLDQMVTRYASETGLTIGQVKADKVLSRVFAIMADSLDTTAEFSVAIYDSRIRNNATGLQLDDMGGAIGVPRQEATFSQVVCTLDGVTGTVIPSGFIVEGGGPDGTSRWALLANVTLTAGADTGVFRAEDSGAITAEIGAVDAIVTAVSGWTTVTNAAAVTLAEAGEPRETDNAYRLRQQQSFQSTGGRSLNALGGQLLALRDSTGALFVQAAVVLDNDTSAIVVKGGVSLDPHSLAVIIHPSTLSAAQQQLIVEQIYAQAPAGIKTMGTDVTGTVTGADGVDKSINYDNATTLAVAVVVTVVLDTGIVISDVEVPVQTAIITFFDNLLVGDPVRILDMLTLVNTVTGVTGASVTLNGGGVDIVPTLSQLAVLTPTPPTVST